MGASASLQRADLAVEPGQQTSTQLLVRNNGGVVDQFTFEGLGTAAPWIEVEPPAVSLFPGAEETVTVHFRPPRVAAVAPGPTPFAVKVVSSEDPGGSATEEGVVTVGRFDDRTVEMFPLTARGRRRGRYELAIDNRGNGPIEVDLAGSDAEGACAYRFAADRVTVEPGAARFVKLAVSPRRTFWRGPAKTHQFQVVVTDHPAAGVADDVWAPPGAPGDGSGTAVAVAEAPPVAPPTTINGSLLQEALLPPWIVKAVLATLALLLALWLLWQLLVKPTVTSAAKDAVEDPIEELQEQVDEIAPTTVPTTTGGQPVDDTGDDGVGAGEDGTGENGAGENGTGDGATDGAGNGEGDGDASNGDNGFATVFGDPTDFQLGIGSAVGAGTSQPFSQPFQTEFALTDLVLQNPGGDIGRVEIARDGTVVFASALENFRDFDLHFVAPYIFEAGQSLTMTVECTTPGPSNPACAVSASFAGFTK